VRTCENCGANAVDSRGICQNCGWHEPRINDSSPSLGETRAAEIPTTQAGVRGNTGSPSPFERTVDLPRYTPPLPSRVGASTGLNTQGGNSRYCGTCGARIERGEVFCGQCGTPVGTGRNSYGGQGMTSSAPSRYVVGDDDSWSPARESELTEAIMPFRPPPMPAQYNRGISGPPYNQSYGAVPGYAASGAQSRSNRTARIVWGVVCLVSSLVVAGAAVLVAIH